MFHDELMKDEEELNEWHRRYDRLSAAVDVSLGKFVEVIEEVQQSAYKTGKDYHITPIMLMYDYAEAIDGVSALVRVGSSKNCGPLLRTGLEISLGLRYILEDKGNYERRSLAYEYFHHADGLKWAHRCDPDHHLGKELRKEMATNLLPDLFDVDSKGIDVKAEVGKHEKKVNSPRYADVRAELNRLKAEKKKAKNWYSLWDGPQDLRQLAIWQRLLSAYEALYRPWSNTAHGEGAIKRVGKRREDGQVEFEALRSPVSLSQRCFEAVVLTNSLTSEVIRKLVGHMLPGFQSWYGQHMKPAQDYILSKPIG